MGAARRLCTTAQPRDPARGRLAWLAGPLRAEARVDALTETAHSDVGQGAQAPCTTALQTPHQGHQPPVGGPETPLIEAQPGQHPTGIPPAHHSAHVRARVVPVPSSKPQRLAGRAVGGSGGHPGRSLLQPQLVPGCGLPGDGGPLPASWPGCTDSSSASDRGRPGSSTKAPWRPFQETRCRWRRHHPASTSGGGVSAVTAGSEACGCSDDAALSGASCLQRTRSVPFSASLSGSASLRPFASRNTRSLRACACTCSRPSCMRVWHRKHRVVMLAATVRPPGRHQRV